MASFEHDDALRSNIRRYRIVKVNDEGTQQRVDLSGLVKEKPEKVWRPMPHGFTSNPPPDSDGYMVGMGGRSDRMLYSDGGHKKYRPRNIPVGAAALYNHSGDIVRVFEDNCDVIHSKRINLRIGRGQDVSGDDGSKPPEGPDAHNISIVATTDGVVITFDDSSVTWKPGELALKSPKVVVDSPAVHLGGEGGELIGLCGGGCATKVWAV
jgi:hypothetical protein